MATELAKAYVQIIPSMRGAEGELKKSLGDTSSSAGTSSGYTFGSMFKKAIAAAGIGIALKKVLGDAFAQGGELQQNLGGTEAVFGQFAKTIQDQAVSAYKNMGMSASDYMATANKMGSLFQGSGIEQQKSLDMTSKAMQRAADVASVMGIDMSMAMESIAGAAKGNFTMMDNLGVAMNATTLEAYALEKGVNFKWNTASNAEKAELAMQMFMERTSQYAGNFARESEQTWTGSIGAMKASYQNLMANIMLGNELDTSLQALAQTVTTFVSGNLIPAMGNILKGLPQALITLTTTLGPQLSQMGADMVVQLAQGIITNLPKWVETWLGLYENLRTTITENAPQLFNMALMMIQQLVIGIKTQLPTILSEGVEIITNLVNGILQNLPALIAGAGQLLTHFLGVLSEAAPIILENGANLLLNIVTGIKTQLPTILSEGVEIITNLVNGILQNLPALIAGAGQLLTHFLGVLSEAAPIILENGANLLLNIVTGIIKNLPQIVVAAATMILRLVTSIRQKLPQILQTGIEIIGKLAAGLVRAIPTMISNIPKITLSIASEFLKTDWGSIGLNIIKGIAKGLANAAHMLWDAVKDILGNFKDKVLDFFGIHSPSRWGEYVGKMISLGFPRGVEGNLDPFRTSMEKLGNIAQKPFGEFDYEMRTSVPKHAENTEERGALERLDRIVEILLMILSGNKEYKFYLKDREVLRALRELGVVVG